MCKPIANETIPESEDNSKTISSDGDTAGARRTLATGTLVSGISIFFLICGLSLTFPQMQSRRDELGCDALCYGSMTSVRGALGLVGTALIGRLSDRNDSLLAKSLGSVGKGGNNSGRRGCLLLGIIASLLGLIIALDDSLIGLWLSMIPGAFLQHNFDVFKSLLSEYHNDVDNVKDKLENDAEECEESLPIPSRSSSVGKLGMTVGISFMIGPMFAAGANPSFQSATYIAIFCILVSGASIFIIPLPLASSKPLCNEKPDTCETQQSNEFTLSKMIKLQTPKTRAAMTLLVIRLNMALAFHIFNTIWPASLKARFQFGPSDHARFMSFIGITYALSQGFVAKRMINALGTNGKVHCICCTMLGIGRYIAFHTDHLVVVYAAFLFIINALGILNTVITADTGTIASKNEIGKLFGILQASESAAGMVGPVLGGTISHYLGKDAPLLAVVGIYTFLFFFMSWGYDGLVLSVSRDERKEMKKSM
mmetsp:Transcript_36950/g.75323  ORF Transcript_36950/g.75323 Transcript_36950/m.75323 type:complete len:482 (+) Transcript_36950:99-1544(+)